MFVTASLENDMANMESISVLLPRDYSANYQLWVDQ